MLGTKALEPAINKDALASAERNGRTDGQEGGGGAGIHWQGGRQGR